MQAVFNPECFYCPRATHCFEAATQAAGQLAGANSMVRSYEAVLENRQQSYHSTQYLEAAAQPGQMDQERAMIRDTYGIELPTEDRLIATRNEVERLREDARLAKEAADRANATYNNLTDGCNGHRFIRRVAGLTIATCQGNDIPAPKRLIVTPSILLAPLT